MKNAFYFTLKAFCYWDILIFVLNFGHVGKWFDKKAKVNFKFYEVANWLTITIHIMSQEVKSIRQWYLVR